MSEHQPTLPMLDIDKTEFSPHTMWLYAPESMLANITETAIARGFRCADVTNFRRYSGGSALTQARPWVQVRVPYSIDQRHEVDALIEDIMRQRVVIGSPVLEAWVGGSLYRYTIKR